MEIRFAFGGRSGFCVSGDFSGGSFRWDMDDILHPENRIRYFLPPLCPIKKEIRKTQGIPGTGKSFEGSGILIIHIDEGKGASEISVGKNCHDFINWFDTAF